MMYGYYGNLGSGYGMMDFGFLALISGLLHLLFWVFVIMLIIRFFKRKGLASGWMHRTPLDILKLRYARGDIDKVEYEEKKRDLEL